MDENIKLARKVIEEGFAKNRPEIIDELASDDFVEHQRGMTNGKLSSQQAIKDLHNAFPDISYQLINSIAQDDLVCVHYKVTGTHRGNLGPLKASGKTFNTDLIDIMRFKNGKLTEHWGIPDRLGLMSDLGFWPPK